MLPDEPHHREGDLPQLQRDRVVRRGARPEPRRRASTATTPCSVPGATDRQRQRASSVSCRASSAQARVLESTFTQRLSRPAAQRRAARRPLLVARRTTRSARPLEDLDYQGGGLPAVQNSNRIELERGAHVRRSHAQFRALRHLEARLLLRLEAGREACSLNGWTRFDDHHAAERLTPHDLVRPGSQPRCITSVKVPATLGRIRSARDMRRIQIGGEVFVLKSRRDPNGN